MKNVQRNRRRQNHRNTLATFVIAVGSCGFILSACQKKLDHQYAVKEGMLRFEVTDTLAWHAGEVSSSTTRSASDSTAPTVTKVEGSLEEGRQMYLHVQENEGIELGTPIQQEVVTRADMVTAGNFHSSFGIYAMTYATGATDYGTVFSPNFMNNVEVTNSQGGSYSTNPKYYIPSGKSAKIFAYAPYGSAANGLDQPTSWANLRPHFNFDTPTYLGQQIDLCFAEATVSRSNSTASLNFQHAMAAILFKVDANVAACKINSIKITNVGSTAKVVPFRTTGWWDEPTTPKEFTYNNGGNGTDHTGTNGDTYIFENDANKAFFLIPQATTSMRVEINVTKNGATQARTLTAALPGDRWSKGNTYTYTLSFSLEDPSTFEITTSNGSWSNTTLNGTQIKQATLQQAGGSLTFNVTSKKGSASLDYKVQYSTTGTGSWTDLPGVANHLLVSRSTKTPNPSDNTRYTHALEVYEKVTISSSQNTTLYNTQAGTANIAKPKRLDGGGETAVQKTANCYMVAGHGWFAFEPVYGNARNAGDNGKVLGKYTGYNNQVINNTKIAADVQGGYARVLWTDVPGLISEIQYTEGLIKFKLDQATIQEGNTVIGFFTSGNVCVWSWHIWVTPDGTGTQKLQNYKGNEIRVLNRPLGYVNPGTANWRNATLYIRFVQSDGGSGWNEGNAKIFAVKQTGPTGVQVPGRYPVYQWGRKDPLLPLSFTTSGGGRDARCYPGPDGKTDYLPTRENPMTNIAHVGEWTKNPHRFWKTSSSTETRRANLWNANLANLDNNGNNLQVSNTETTVKSLFDPSPLGFKVAPPGTFDDFGQNSSGYYDDISPDSNPLTATGGYPADGWGGLEFDSQHNQYITQKVLPLKVLWNAPTTYYLPLLGGRFASPTENWAPKGYGEYFFTWMTGKPSGGKAIALGVYYQNSTYNQVSLYGGKPANSSSYLFSLDLQEFTNAYPIIPIQE